MPREIQILIVEDMPADVVLINHELRKGGLLFRSKRVTTREEFVRALEGTPPDLILSDHGLPQFDGFTALAIARERVPDVPFLFVTGSMGEEVAIESLRKGATDYVLKNRLDALAQAVRRALKLAEERKRRREAERALSESEDHFRSLVESIKEYAIFMLDATGHVTTWSRGVEFILGYGAADILGCSYEILFDQHELEQEVPARLLDSAASAGRVEWEGMCLRRTGPRFSANLVLGALREGDGQLRGFSVILRDESERHRAAEELRRSEARHTAILASAIDAIVSIDHEGFVREWNAAAEHLFQYSREDAVGRKIDALIVTPELNELYTEGLAKYLITGVGSMIGRPVEMKARRADGTEFPVEIGVSRIGGSSPALYSAVIRDITVHKAAVEEVARLNAQLEERVKERTRELESANQELESFSYSVSHDLRAPLRHITGFVSMLQSQSADRLDATGKELLQNIATAAARMSRLIEALLVFSRTGRADLQRLPVDLGELARSVQDELRGEQRGRKVEWKVGALPAVQGDPDLLRQVLVNLLSNALKYTRPRPVARIELGAETQGAEVVLTVRDNGVGFDPRYADRLFGVFQRLHRPAEFEGTGIGLATVRLIVQRHGGRVWAQAEPGKGATFHVALPASGGTAP